MMKSAAGLSIVLGFTGLATLGPGAQPAPAQQRPAPQVRIEYVFPQQVPRGQTTALNVAVPGRDLVQSAEISPSNGVTVAGLRKGENHQGMGWWEVTVNVANDAAAGPRSLVLAMPMGRTLPYTITVPTHAPRISDLKVLSGQASQPAVELQFAATDPSTALGASPYVWFALECVPDPILGAVRGKVTAGVVRASIPNPRTIAGAPPAGRCDVLVRATDATGIDSNTLSTTVEFKH